MLEDYPDCCYEDITLLKSVSRTQQPYLAFLKILSGHWETASSLFHEQIGKWQKLVTLVESLGSSQDTLERLQRLTIAWEKSGLKIGGGRGAHRKGWQRSYFEKALIKYAEKLEDPTSRERLTSREWTVARAAIMELPGFGNLAGFDYLELMCLLGCTNPPDEYLLTGRGPQGGIEMIFSKSEQTVFGGNELLQLLKKRTADRNVIFALETFLCQMQKPEVKQIFERYLNDSLQLRHLLNSYARIMCHQSQTCT